MNTPTVFNVGVHQYYTVTETVGSRSRIIVCYNLFGVNGHTQRIRKGKPNAHGWRRSSETFPRTVPGISKCRDWIEHLLRPQDSPND